MVKVSAVVAVVESERGVFLVRRPDDGGRLAGFWGLPRVDGTETWPEDPAAALGRRLSGDWTLGKELGQVRHAVTRHAIRARVHRASVRWSAGEAGEALQECGWFEPSTLEDIALDALSRKALELPG